MGLAVQVEFKCFFSAPFSIVSALFSVENGAGTIQNGAETIENGAKTIENGAETIENGAPTIENSAETIENGVVFDILIAGNRVEEQLTEYAWPYPLPMAPCLFIAYFHLLKAAFD